jgi:PiT family inorganic phosphate transporter
MGLIMMILIAVLPAHFAIKSTHGPETAVAAVHASHEIAAQLSRPETKVFLAATPSSPELIRNAMASDPEPKLSDDQQRQLSDVTDRLARIESLIASRSTLAGLKSEEKTELRAQILKVDGALSKLEKDTALAKSANWTKIQASRKTLKSLVEYTPSWVILIVALSIGLGTMVGWKRIVVTIGEKIGKSHLTYAQGASAELVAMATIGVSAVAGLPVSTTHCLSSGIAGSMVANKSGLQPKTVKSIALAWVLTLPVSMALSGALFILLMQFAK